MSRIYEALQQSGSDDLEFFLGSTAEVSALIPAPPPAPRPEACSAILPVRPFDPSKAPVPPLLMELRARCGQPGWNVNPDHSVFAGSLTKCAEQFRKLRSRLYHIREAEPIRVVQVTSTLPQEGKSFVALNLALTIIRHHGRRVLLVDADLRMPKLSAYLGVPAKPGLSDYLADSADAFSATQKDAEGNLFFVAAGQPVKNPAELLATGRFQELLDRLAPAFDWIIVDTPPVLPVADAAILARSCDGVLMVVGAGMTGYDQVAAALQDLHAKRVLGVVLNRADEAEPGGAYAYYGTNETGVR